LRILEELPKRQGSDNGKTVTVVFSEPFTDRKSLFSGLLPAHYATQEVPFWNSDLWAQEAT
jgi:hypothetical protein